jgi:hypothetical protein
MSCGAPPAIRAIEDTVLLKEFLIAGESDR